MNNKGFTLIDAMIVVAIIGIAIAIIIPIIRGEKAFEVERKAPAIGDISCENGLSYFYTGTGYEQQIAVGGGGIKCSEESDNPYKKEIGKW